MRADQVRTVSDLYPRAWLHAEDLGDKAWSLRIVAVDVEDLRQIAGQGLAIVLTFRGANRRMVCNKTQARALAAIAGTEALEGWIGLQVVLRAGMAPNGRPTIVLQGVEDES